MTPPTDWLERCRAIEARGKPVLLTVRLRSEGGEWNGDDAARLKIFEDVLAVVSAVDIELSSVICSAVTHRAQKLGKVCLVSHHDFAKTPPLAELESIVERAEQNGAVAKIATMIRSEADVGHCAPCSAENEDVPFASSGWETPGNKPELHFQNSARA